MYNAYEMQLYTWGLRVVRCGWTVLRCCGHLIASQRVTEISDCIMQSYRPSVQLYNNASEELYSTYVNWSLLQPMSPQPHSHHIIRLPLGWKNGTQIYDMWTLGHNVKRKEWAINPSVVADITNPNITMSAYYYSHVHICNAYYQCPARWHIRMQCGLFVGRSPTFAYIALVSDLCKWIYN